MTVKCPKCDKPAKTYSVLSKIGAIILCNDCGETLVTIGDWVKFGGLD